MLMENSYLCIRSFLIKFKVIIGYFQECKPINYPFEKIFKFLLKAFIFPLVTLVIFIYTVLVMYILNHFKFIFN